MISVGDLLDQVNAHVAVDRALDAFEEGMFLTHLLVGPFDGARPADWLDHAAEGDEYDYQISTWWFLRGEPTVNYLQLRLQLPEILCRRILRAAALATFAVAGHTPPKNNLDIPQLAVAAGLWARGYAEGLGWGPQGPSECGATNHHPCQARAAGMFGAQHACKLTPKHPGTGHTCTCGATYEHREGSPS